MDGHYASFYSLMHPQLLIQYTQRRMSYYRKWPLRARSYGHSVDASCWL